MFRIVLDVNPQMGTVTQVGSATQVEAGEPGTKPIADPYPGQHAEQPWPHEIVINGLRMMSKGPINPDWQPGMEVMFAPASGEKFIWDIANGDELNPPRPLRTPNGYPIRWTIVNGQAIGTQTVNYAGHAFNNDQEIESFKKAVAARDAALNQASGGFSPGPR